MNPSKNTLSLALAALALLAFSIEHASAQNNWTNVGPSPGGGFIIDGSSAPTDLGVLSTSSTPVFLSGNGFNIITVFPGNTATGNYAVDISNNNNVLNNSGTLTGADYPVFIYGANNIINNRATISSTYDPVYEEGTQNNTFNNWGAVTNTGSGDYDIYSDGSHFTLNNYSGGTITGATYQAIYSDGGHFTFNNWGLVSTPSTSYGIYSTGNFFTLNNNSGGMISTPGSSYGIYSTGSNATINNWGTISSASSSYGIYSTGASLVLNNYSGGVISASSSSYNIYLDGGNAILNNWGTISCTNGDYTVLLYSSNNIVNNWGTISSTYDPIYEDGSHDTLNNWGMIAGTGDYGVYTDGGYFTVNNYSGGTITGASSYAVYSDGGNLVLNNWGGISSSGDIGVYIEDSGHNAVNNWGTVTAAGVAVDIYHSHDNTVTNFGYITSTADDGIYIYESSRNTVNNWGAITGPNDSIVIQDSSRNTINLDGHSSANGTVSIVGSHNTVNLDFTGLSPATIANLKAILIPQGVNSGNNTTATFTLRGVTYNIDPAVINFNPSSYQLQALTPNEAAIGANLDSLTYNPAPGTSLFALLNAIDQSGNVPGALQALSPEPFGLYGDLAIANSNFLVNSIDARLNNLRDGSESIDTSGMGGDTVAGLTKDDGKSSKEIQPTAPAPDRWGFFATGDGLFFRDSGKADTAGTVAGVDGKVGDHGVIGALFAYNNSAVTLGGASGQATIQSFTEGIYGSWKDDGFYTNGLAVFTRNDYKSARNIAIPGFPATANADANSNQYTANADGGYDFNINSRLTLGPTLGLQYVHMDQFGFNETGAGAADLAVSGEDMNSLQTRLGLHADYHLLTGKFSSGALDFHAAWQHEYLNDSRPIGAAFEGTGLAPFSVQTASPLRDAAVVGTGLNFTFHNRLTLFTEYELEYWRSNTFEQTISGGARISF